MHAFEISNGSKNGTLRLVHPIECFRSLDLWKLKYLPEAIKSGSKITFI